MEKLINNGAELYEHFMSSTRLPKERQYKFLNDGFFVDSKVRAEVLTSIEQGTIIIGGTVRKIVFENFGGGVWIAKVKKL